MLSVLKKNGVLGVLAALEVLRSMQDAGVKTRRGVGVVNWTAEEGSRFEPSILGSAGITGKYDIEFIHDLRDDDVVAPPGFYRQLGYAVDEVVSMGKRLVDDTDGPGPEPPVPRDA